LLLIAPASSARTSSAQQGGLYVALGDSIAAGLGASSLVKSYVQLYYGYLQSSGSGVTGILNPSRPGATSTDLRKQQLGNAVAVINQSSDTKAVTIDIGLNDLLRTSSARPRTRRRVRLRATFERSLQP
jgi:lysophospholipase L1-like esterase